MKLCTAIGFGLLAVGSMLPAAHAQLVQDRTVGAVGGGRSSAGPYELVDTLGETFQGEAASADYSLRSGFQSTLNLPPVPRQDLLLATAQGGKIRVASLVTNDIEPDDETLSLVQVLPTGASGGTVTISEGWLLYRPVSPSITSELLTYVVADTDGHRSLGTILVQRPETPNDAPRTIVSLRMLPAGTRSILFAGIAGRSYSVQTKDDLSEPAWMERTVVVAGGNGQFEFEDPQLPAPAQRYYRAIAR
jgi:hypothetical protein